jgi:hypothetical protein
MRLTTPAITKDHFTGKDRNDFRRNRECRQDEHIDFWVTEYPKEVHPKHGGPASRGIEEMAAKIAVDH